MTPKYFQKIILQSFILFTALSWIPALADITMGVFPRRSPATTLQLFQPLADHLSVVLGEKVTLSVPKNFQDFWKKLKTGQYDIVHYNQYHYIKSHKEMGYNVIAVNEEVGSKTISGALAVRVDSGINSIDDLRGKTILFAGGKKAMVSYIAPTALLKKHGLIAGKDYKAQFAKNPPSAAIAVYNKAADASGTGNIILKIKAVSEKINTSKMKILLETDPLIHLTWAVNKDVPADVSKKIQEAMTSLKNTEEGRKVLAGARVTGFYKATDADFAKIREITKFALDEDY